MLSLCEIVARLEDALMGVKGSYLFFVCCSGDVSVRTKRRFFFVDEGLYVYVGSGWGTGGVLTRLRRHACISGRPFWHIDFLLRSGCTPVGFSVLPSAREREVAAALSGMHSYVTGFGCSDDPRSPSHLFAVKNIFVVYSSLAERGLTPGLTIMLGECL